jgi:hypothetical protein
VGSKRRDIIVWYWRYLRVIKSIFGNRGVQYGDIAWTWVTYLVYEGSEIRFKGQILRNCIRSLKYATPFHLKMGLKVSFQCINVHSLRNAEVETDIKDRNTSEYRGEGIGHERSEKYLNRLLLDLGIRD